MKGKRGLEKAPEISAFQMPKGRPFWSGILAGSVIYADGAELNKSVPFYLSS